VEQAANRLWAASTSSVRVDATETFLHTLRSSSGRRFRIVCFPNDYIETLVLLRFYEELLDKYAHVEVDFVPRSLRCGNDFCFGDWAMVGECYRALATNPRFRVQSCGPKIGAVNLRKLHPTVMSLATAADLLDIRGARSYEMMQALNKEAYYSFMVCRDISESVTGLHAKDVPFIFLRQPPHQRSFDGFRRRAQRVEHGKMLAEVTVMDNHEKWQGGHLATISSWPPEKRQRYEITQIFYGENAPYFHNRFGENLEVEVRSFLDVFQGRVLVLGCGSGKEVAYLTKNGCDAYGIDFSDEAVYLARNLHPDLWERFQVEDFYNLATCEFGEFDGIVANASLVHLLERDDLVAILLDAKRRLVIGGQCFVRLLNKNGVHQEFDSQLFNRPRWFVYYAGQELADACERAGLLVVRQAESPHVNFPGVSWVSTLSTRVG
jgi:SAM-dependent methyltransferase